MILVTVFQVLRLSSLAADVLISTEMAKISFYLQK